MKTISEFYWYEGTDSDSPDIVHGWQIVEVIGTEVFITGSKIGIQKSDMEGQWVGPLKPPD